MEWIIGVGLALAVSIMATCIGFDRDRSFYPVVMIVIALFVLVSIIGFKLNLWWVAAALFGHGIFDLFHHRLIANPGVPVWWPMFCSAYDVTAAAYLAWLLNRSKLSARPVRRDSDVP